MTDTKQPEALRLARQLADFAEQDQSEWPGDMNWIILAASAEMKGQHARTTALEAENRALKGELEAIGAGGVTGLRANNTRDAARYRFIRDTQYDERRTTGIYDMASGAISKLWVGTGGGSHAPRGSELDSAIDAAIAQEGGK